MYIFKSSFDELKKTKTLTILGLLLAIALILNTQSINIGGNIIIKFSFLCNAVAGFLFGPFASGALSGLTDIFTNLLFGKNGSYNPLFTFSAILAGLIYGLFLYKNVYDDKKLILRIILSKLLVVIIVNLILNTLFISFINGKAFIVLIAKRVFKEIILVPIQCILSYLVLKTLNKVYYKLFNN